MPLVLRVLHALLATPAWVPRSSPLPPPPRSTRPPRLTAGEVRSEVRRGFELHRSASEPYAIKYALSEGRTRLKQLSEMIGLSS